MKNFTWFLLLLLLTVSSCSDDKKASDRRQARSMISGIFTSTVGAEKTDSIQIDSFIAAYREFEPYQHKIHKFYKRRKYELAWSVKGEFVPQASMFLNLVKSSDSLQIVNGLPAVSGLLDTLQEVEEGRKSSRENIYQRHKLDLLLTSLYFQYSRLSWKGQIEPDQDSIPWYITPKKIQYGKTLDSILASESDNPFLQYMPVHPEYKKLMYVLYELKAVEKNGGWPRVEPASKKLAEGDSGTTVAALRRRLNFTRDIRTDNGSNVFTPDLTNAVKNFQRRHGLIEDGICAGRTLEEINVPVEARIRQLLVNLERWRWVPEKQEKNYLVINIPEFQLRAIEDNKTIWTMKVIVGGQMNNTPIFNDKLEYIVVNPTWNVPHSIAVKEFLPIIRENPGILIEQNFEVYQGKETNIIDPYTIQWDSLSEENFPYSLKQLPGLNNSLGKIKFLFPNNFSVYLHDTPAISLFEKNRRTFSHGCIRLQEPLKLAEYLLRKNSKWNAEKLTELVGTESTWIKLSPEEQLPVYILYFTVWIDENGQVNYREDIYGHDKKMEKLLIEPGVWSLELGVWSKE